MTLDLLLFFAALGFMAVALLLRKPITLIAAITVAQWYVGLELLNQLNLTTSSELVESLLEAGFRLSLPLLSVVLVKRRATKPGTLQLLLIVVWGTIFSSLLLEVLLPVLGIGSGYFYNLTSEYRLEGLVGLLLLSFLGSLGGVRTKN